MRAALFHQVSLWSHVPQDHALRSTDRCVELGSVCAHLADVYGHIDRGLRLVVLHLACSGVLAGTIAFARKVTERHLSQKVS